MRILLFVTNVFTIRIFFTQISEEKRSDVKSKSFWHQGGKYKLTLLWTNMAVYDVTFRSYQAHPPYYSRGAVQACDFVVRVGAEICIWVISYGKSHNSSLTFRFTTQDGEPCTLTEWLEENAHLGVESGERWHSRLNIIPANINLGNSPNDKLEYHGMSVSLSYTGYPHQASAELTGFSRNNFLGVLSDVLRETDCKRY